MQRVQGVGGVFIRAKDQQALARWYAANLGLNVSEEWWGAVLPLQADDEHGGACTVWSAFPPETDYFGETDRAFMINFRVHDLDAMLAQLRENGCNVLDKVERNDFGQFGWVVDPEGNRVELWQPPEKMPGAE